MANTKQMLEQVLFYNFDQEQQQLQDRHLDEEYFYELSKLIGDGKSTKV